MRDLEEEKDRVMRELESAKKVRDLWKELGEAATRHIRLLGLLGVMSF